MQDDEIFRESMETLGVEPLDASGEGERRRSERRRRERRRRERETADRRLFEQALREPIDAELFDAEPRRRPRSLRGRRLRVERRLDLHGMTAEEALERLERFLVDARTAGARTVLVITGKGRHSPGGVGVVRGRVEAWLARRGRGLGVVEFAPAPERLGGGGAYLLRLGKRGG